MTTDPSTPTPLHLPDDLRDEARLLVGDLTDVVGSDEATILAALQKFTSEHPGGLVDALRVTAAALVVTLTECLTIVPLDQPTNTTR